EGEEFQERRWVEELEHREAANDECEVNPEELDSQFPPDPDIFSLSKSPISDCPICGLQFINFSEEQVSIHVNKCLDGKITTTISKTSASATVGQLGCDAERLPPGHTPPKPAQPSPFPLNSVHAGQPSAFSKLMASNAEDAAWANAAASEEASRGKRSFERTCPFYKILPGFAICVDAFRYGAVEGCQAYFLSHFHSDHYIGLSGKWCHGPIYCSRATGNLVRQQLRVDPKWVVDLDFEQETEVPGTGGVTVIMIPANHCPGSSLFLFQKALGKGPNPKKRRVLHCGDFRACRSHVEHPHLCPSIPCPTSGKTKLQKIDVCYLDTTYLNPKYAFPPQEDVVQACVDMSVSLNNSTSNLLKGTKQEGGLAQFVKNGDTAAPLAGGKSDIKRNQGRLLIVVGTYSIGKEKICIAIAKALKSKIFASTPKRRICACLEDPELDELLTSNPREAQVHMAPLSELQPQTLDAYLQDFQDCFQSIVGFRPSGWNYRPPTGRSMTNLTVKTVLFGQNWKSRYAVNNMGPQRGSTKRAACFGVPYSEHSSFRELTMFCCALHIDRIIPTVNTGSAKSRQMMRYWADQWGAERRKNGLF
ncbi:DRMBL-domain-containing protein, partial [Trichodelitschia bisporula]